MIKMTYREAIRSAIWDEMNRDERVFVYGQGVTDEAAIFGTTVGLQKQFGESRCFDTPISEDAMTGFGLGAAINGLRPINIHIRADFLLLAINQLGNMISSIHYGSNGKLNAPFVIRAVIGRGWGQSYQHSKSMQSIFAHFPGLKVFMPSTPSDARNMTIAAIRDNNPVILLEHRLLYDVEDVVEDFTDIESLEQPSILREGCDLTIASTSWMNVEALQAAEILSKYGIETQVINVRSIAPFKENIIVDSVLKTKHLIIADSDWLNCGFSAEVATRVYDRCFTSLQSPIERVGHEAVPCPCARQLETIFYSGAKTIVEKAQKMFDIQNIDISGYDFYSYENKFKGPF